MKFFYFFILIELLCKPLGSTGYVWLEEALDEWNQVSSLVVWKDIFWIFVIYLFVLAIRVVILQVVAYFIGSESIRWREAFLVSMGEVRGQVSMLLAFIVLNDPELSWTQQGCDSSTRFNPANPFVHSRTVEFGCSNDVLDIEVALNRPLSSTTSVHSLSDLYAIGTQKIFFYGMGVLILTHLINATSLDAITNTLGIYQISSGIVLLVLSAG